MDPRGLRAVIAMPLSVMPERVREAVRNAEVATRRALALVKAVRVTKARARLARTTSAALRYLRSRRA